MTDSACGKCGAPRAPGSSPGGLCPGCLLGVAITYSPLEPKDGEDVDGIPEGTTFGSFLIRRPVGRGGMGAVYEALDTQLDRAVALKVLPAEFLHDPTFARRFEREARLAARLEHPNIVPIYATGIEAGIPWMSMRLLTGDNLSALLAKRRLLPAEAVQLLKQVAAALDHAHAFGVVHRDIKPANILLDRSGAACVADFGLAQLMESTNRLTRTGMLTGTPHYMSPEQALGQRVDHRCDIYALGIVAYEMMVGRTPFTGDSPVAVLLQQVHQPLPAPADQVPPAGWMDAIYKATAKNPAERWPSAGAFAEALESSLSARAVSDNLTETAASRLAWSRTRVGVTALAIAVLIAAASLWVMIQSGEPVSREGPSPTAASEPTIEPPAGTGLVPPQDEAGKTVAVPQAPARTTKSQPPPQRGPRDTAQSPPEPAPPSTAAPSEPVTSTPPAPLPTIEVSRKLESLIQLPGATVPPPPVASGFRPPNLTRRAPLKYPAAASAAGLEGEVVLTGLVGIDGTVSDIGVVKFSNQVFVEAARTAFREYKYEPARRNGVAVPFRIDQPIKFVLSKD